MRGALRRMGYELGAALLRMCGYLGAIAMLGVFVAKFLEGAEISAVVEPPTIERPFRAFAFNGDRIEEPDRPKLRRTVAAQ